MRFNFYLANDATTPGQLDTHLLHLTHKLYGLGQRVVVRCPDAERMERVSLQLWKTPRESFLPHSCDGEDLPPDMQPVYLTTYGGNPNGAHVLMRLSGSDEDTQGVDEVIEFFSGLEAEKAAARKRWQFAKEKGAPRRFFVHENGRWQLKQEAG